MFIKVLIKPIAFFTYIYLKKISKNILLIVLFKPNFPIYIKEFRLLRVIFIKINSIINIYTDLKQ